MNVTTSSMESLWGLGDSYRLAATTVLALTVLLAVYFFGTGREKTKNPPMLDEIIPFFSNTFQFAANRTNFLARTYKALETRNILGFYLGGNKSFLLTGGQNTQAFFRNSPSIGFERSFLYAFQNMTGATPDDLAKFANDKSGRSNTPLPGTEDTGNMYQQFFSEEMDAHFPLGEWTEVNMLAMLKLRMTKAGILTFQGKRIFEAVPDIIDLAWEFDAISQNIFFGPPKWLFRGSYAIRDRFSGAVARFQDDAMERFDWDGADAEADWEPVFGSRFSREFARWMRDSGFSSFTRGGLVGTVGIIATNANTIPVATWALIHILTNPHLLPHLRSELTPATTSDPATGTPKFDIPTLLSTPLLQSIYTETLRLHVSVMITRDVVAPFDVEGYVLPKGSILQAPMGFAHLREGVWGVEGHPASEFWAERHLKTVNGERVFEMAGKGADFSPYGGGIPMCPGRHFAKQEIMLTVAMLVSKFEFEFVEWVKKDGTRSDRPPKNDSRYEASGGMPPDVDMKVRMKRIW
ncbi:cytochrome P450 [Immersiella caudata]|uniref:Cytochrome P450 n=1 Tax=Immersiella caudata TaxID=314043 RepID=A0AA39TTN6_9PEZI|nr:cytochrome P450 [Immersiella caudata]